MVWMEIFLSVIIKDKVTVWRILRYINFDLCGDQISVSTPFALKLSNSVHVKTNALLIEHEFCVTLVRCSQVV